MKGKLTLSKETLRTLADEQLTDVAGGFGSWYSCNCNNSNICAVSRGCVVSEGCSGHCGGVSNGVCI